jgi:hypothetical protein
VVKISDKVTNLGLVFDRDFSWASQVNQIIRRGYGALNKPWITVDLLPTETMSTYFLPGCPTVILHGDVFLALRPKLDFKKSKNGDFFKKKKKIKKSFQKNLPEITPILYLELIRQHV